MLNDAVRGALVGRHDEVAALRAWARRAADGIPRVGLVLGELGIGKSRLLAEARTELSAEGFRVAAGGCVDIPGVDQAHLPFGPFLEAMRELPDAVRPSRSPAPRAWLEGERSGAAGPASDRVQDRFDRFFEAVTGVTAVQPLLILVEDLQWADRSSLALLVHLARNLSRERLLVLVSVRMAGDLPESRPGSAAAVLAALDHLRRLPQVEVLELDRLGAPDVRALVEAASPVPRSRSAVDAIVARAEGNALVATELSRHADPEGGNIPSSLSAAVRDRLRDCPAPALLALRAAAVLGRDVDQELLVELIGTATPELAGPAVPATVDAASGTGLLLPQGHGYRFRHGVDRDVVYEHTPLARRRALHAAAAAALEARVRPWELRADSRAEIAEHWVRSGQRATACRSCLDAARAAVRLDAYPEAVTHFEKGLMLWPPPDAGSRAAVLIEAAEAARWANRLSQARGFLADAVDAATTPEERARAWERLAWVRRVEGSHTHDADQALPALGGDQTSAAAAHTLATYAAALVLARHPDTRERAEQAIAAARASGEAEPLASALITLGCVKVHFGDVEAGLGMIREGRDTAKRIGAWEHWWRGQTDYFWALDELGRFQEIASAVPELVERLDGPGARPPGITVTFSNAAWALAQLGNWTEAEALCRRVVSLAHEPYDRHAVLSVLGHVDILRGDFTRARETVEQCAAFLGVTSFPHTVAETRWLQAELAAGQADLATARTWIDEALAPWRQLDLRTIIRIISTALRIEADLGRAPGHWAPARVTFLGRAAERALHAPIPMQRGTTIDALQCQAEWIRLIDHESDGSDERYAWEAHLDVATGQHLLYCEAYGRLRLAECHLRRGKRDVAAKDLAAAYDIAARLGAGPLIHTLRATARRARLPLPEHVPDRGQDSTSAVGAAGLTRREIDVLRLLLDGRTNRQIARALTISERTVAVHVSHVITKLGVRNRSEAAAAAHRLRLLDPAD